MRMTPQALARSLAVVARGLRRALQRRLQAEQQAGAGAVLELQREVSGTLVALDAREFADAWAQTLVYLLLATRWLAPGEDPARHLPLRLARCDARLAGLVARLLELAEVQALQRALAGVTLVHAEVDDPVMHFYEAFLAAYDPRLRAARGVYFTPTPVVDYLVETTDAVLRDRLGLSEGLADTTSFGEYAGRRGFEVPPGVDPACPFVQVVDPAAGTGTFVIAVIRRAHATMLARWAGGDPAAQRLAWSEYVHTRLLPRLRGVERMIAPWAIAVLRLSMLLTETGVEGVLATPVFLLGDTLAGPDLLRCPISVVLGNPPYEREKPQAPGGGWIRQGTGRTLLADFVEPARAAGAGAHVKNLYNLYVYFWRWACWQVFERRPQAPGVVAMVTGASFLRGPGFVGMRAHLRRCAPQIHVLDLEGDRRGANVSDNVFSVSVPVAATTLVRDLSARAGVEIHRAQGSAADKLELCARTRALEQLRWTAIPCGGVWIADEMSAGFHAWPRLTDLFPWQHSGAQWKRTWPIAADPEVLARRWQALMDSEARGELFHETRDRSVEGQVPPLRSPGLGLTERTAEAIAEASGVPMPPVRRYGFRALDRRYCLADARLGDFLRPALWWVAGGRQVYLTSLLTGALGPGAAAMVSAEVPDLHYFCGRGGKDVIPLWRDPAGVEANIGAGVLRELRAWYGEGLRADDLQAYVYALLSAPGYMSRFAAELRGSGPRVALVRDIGAWEATVALGRRAIALHCFAASVSGAARCMRAPTQQPTTVRHVDDTLRFFVGDVCVGEFAPVAAQVWTYSLSGYRPVPGWISGRLARRAGRRSSRLDAIHCEHWTAAMNDELLELLWTVEATLALGGALDEALAIACAGPCWLASELPLPTDAERREPELPARGNIDPSIAVRRP